MHGEIGHLCRWLLPPVAACPAGMMASSPTPFLFSPQYEVSGEEHLYSDFPEIDLSQLDASDFDSASCFSELQWCGEHSETDSSQYSTDDSELFQVPPSSWHRGPEDGGRRRAEEEEKEGTHTAINSYSPDD